MFNKSRLALLGYGKTTKAIAKKLGGGCIFFDDTTKSFVKDAENNCIYPSDKFDASCFDLEVATPSIYPANPLVEKSQNLLSEYDFFLSDKSPLVTQSDRALLTVWISGTNGKTTTTQMLTHLLADRGAVSGGNIGTPLADLESTSPIWVLETSSFTLHHTKYASPNIYLLLPITPDHLDWHGSSKEYTNDKLKPLLSMQEGELALIPKGLQIPPTNAWVVEYESVEDLERLFGIESSKIKFRGAFLLDSLLAMAVAKVLFDEVDYARINSFTLDAHRQEELRDAWGRLWVNDSKATNVDAALQAIKLYSNRKIHLILGGDDKGVNLEPFFKEIEEFDITIYAIGSNTQKLMDLANKYSLKAEKAYTLDAALPLVNAAHTRKSVALLAPAASSLDQFGSYAQRGEAFKEFVKNLRNS